MLKKEMLGDFCTRHHIRRIGMLHTRRILHDTPVDVLVEFAPDANKALEFLQIQQELADLMEQPICLNTFSYYEKSHMSGTLEILFECE